MKKVKHISFDLWMTLIKSNPIFKSERVKYFFEHHNTKFKTLEEINLIIREVDLMCNKINELKGNSISAEEMYLMVLYRINENLNNYNLECVSKIYNEINEIFELYPPTFYDQNTFSVLKHQKEKKTSMSILSNTAFIKGASLLKVLRNLELFDFFEFIFFSDEFNLSKPNPLFFKNTFNKIASTQTIQQSEILHVGDNYLADFLGAQNFGYQALVINSNDKSILELHNI